MACTTVAYLDWAWLPREENLDVQILGGHLRKRSWHVALGIQILIYNLFHLPWGMWP